MASTSSLQLQAKPPVMARFASERLQAKQSSSLISSPLRGGQKEGFPLLFSPPLRGRMKEGVSVLLSPFQGETQKGFPRVETSPQPSPERRGRSTSSPLRGGQKRGFLYSLPITGGESKRGFPLWRRHSDPLFPAFALEETRRTCRGDPSGDIALKERSG